jgi:hypothetical protein
MQCDQCLHVTFTMNQLYLIGGPVPLHFPLYAIVSGNRNLKYKSHQFAAVA